MLHCKLNFKHISGIILAPIKVDEGTLKFDINQFYRSVQIVDYFVIIEILFELQSITYNIDIMCEIIRYRRSEKEIDNLKNTCNY